MANDRDFPTHDILRDKAPFLCARLYSDNRYAGTGTGYEILQQYDSMLFQGATEHDFSEARKDLRQLIALTNTLLAEGILIDRLSTYEAERALRAPANAREDSKLRNILDESQGHAQDMAVSMLEVESTCRSAIHHLYPRQVDSVNVLLDEFGEAVTRLQSNLQNSRRSVGALQKRTDLEPSDPEARKQHHQTLAFVNEVSEDALRITSEMQGLIAGLKEQRSADETQNPRGNPLPFAQFAQRVAALANATVGRQQQQQQSRPRFDPEAVARRIEGTVAVSIHDARQTKSYQNRMAARDTTGNDRGGR